MVSWQDLKVTEPPRTRHLSNNDLQRLLQAEKFDRESELVLIGLPNHTQAAEKEVKEVTV